MTKDGENNQQALLTPLGFVPEGRQTWTLWRLSPEALAPLQEPRATAAKPRASARVPSPWRLTALELAERRGALSLLKLVMTLDKSAFLANLAGVTRKHFGGRTSGSYVPGSQGDVWCVFEFLRPGTRELAKGHAQKAAGQLLPLGAGGFDVRLMADGAQGQVLVSDVFGFGYLPPVFGSAPLRFVADALGLKAAADTVDASLKGDSVNELRFPLHLPALLHLKDRGAGPEALAALHGALAKMRGTPTPIVLAGEGGLTFVTPGEDAEPAHGTTEVAFAPLEVLESRERAAKYRDVDALLLSGKPSRALKVASERLTRDPGSLYLMRRLSLLALSGRQDPEATFLPHALAKEPDHKLFLSLAVANGLAAGEPAQVLDALSRLGGLLMTQIPGADQLPAFDVALPELLGDAWVAEDPLKAEECYHRVLERRGDLPRLLRKLIGLARQRGRSEQEVGYLHRLAAVERRRSELARLTLRLAELRRGHATGQEEAVQLALKALKLDRSHVPAARLAGDLLVERGRPEEAIQLLDSLLKDARLPLTAAARAELEASVGLIWLGRLGRADLAETRFEQALTHDPRHWSALKELEALARGRVDEPGLARILELQFTVHEAAADGESMKRLFDELVPLYRGPLGQPQRAYDLYQRLLVGDATPQDVDLLLGWRDVDIDWSSLYTRLAQSLPRLPAGQARGQFLCRLAELVRDKLGDASLALRHLRGALDEGWIDAAGFAVLVETLGRERDYAGLAYAYERRLGQVPASDQRRLLAELLAVPEVLSEARRDALAVQAYQLDAEAERLVQGRFHVAQGQEDVDGVARLVDLLLAEARLTTLQQGRWLRFAVEVLEGMQDERRFALIDGFYRRLLERDEDRAAVLQDGIESLKSAADGARLVYYVAELLSLGLLPALDERRVQTLLSGLDHELALFHQLLSFKAAEPGIQAQHARIAAVLYGKRANQEANTETMIARLCTLVPCAESDLAQLRGLVVRSGNWTLLAKALQRQADFEDERQRKYTLLEQLGVLYWKKLKDHARARLTFVLAMKHSPQPAKLKLVLATIAAEAGDGAQERKALVDFLVDVGAADDLRAMTRAVERLLQLGEDGAALTRLVQPRLDLTVQSGDWEKVLQLAQVLLDNQVASTELCRTAFKAALFTGHDARVVDSWWRGLACVSNKTKAKAYMIETAAILDKEGRRDLQLASYGAALDNGIGAQLGPKIEHELRLQYGALLFDTDTKRRKALAVYREAHASEPDDHRTWMPLYFLLLEFGRPADRLAHLTEILPKLAQDPRPLKPFPLTVESLKVELRELRQQTLKAEPKETGLSPADLESVAGEEEDDAGVAPRFASQPLPPMELGDLGEDDEEEPLEVQRVAGDGPGFGLPLPPSPPHSGEVARSFTVVGRDGTAASPAGGAEPAPVAPKASAPTSSSSTAGKGRVFQTSRPRALPPLPSMTGPKDDDGGTRIQMLPASERGAEAAAPAEVAAIKPAAAMLAGKPAGAGALRPDDAAGVSAPVEPEALQEPLAQPLLWQPEPPREESASLPAPAAEATLDWGSAGADASPSGPGSDASSEDFGTSPAADAGLPAGGDLGTASPRHGLGTPATSPFERALPASAVNHAVAPGAPHAFDAAAPAPAAFDLTMPASAANLAVAPTGDFGMALPASAANLAVAPTGDFGMALPASAANLAVAPSGDFGMALPASAANLAVAPAGDFGMALPASAANLAVAPSGDFGMALPASAANLSVAPSGDFGMALPASAANLSAAPAGHDFDVATPGPLAFDLGQPASAADLPAAGSGDSSLLFGAPQPASAADLPAAGPGPAGLRAPPPPSPPAPPRGEAGLLLGLSSDSAVGLPGLPGLGLGPAPRGGGAPPSVSLFDPALPLGAGLDPDAPSSDAGDEGIQALPPLPGADLGPSSGRSSDDDSFADGDSDPLLLGTPGAFTLDATGARARPRAAPGRAAPAPAPADSAEVSSIELAAAIDAPHPDLGNDSDDAGDAGDSAADDESDHEPASAAGTGFSGLPLPRHDSPADGSRWQDGADASADASAVPPGPPRFGGTQPSQLGTSAGTSGGTSAGGEGNVLSSGEPAFGLHVEAADDVADWRAAVLKGDFNADLTGRLLKQAFASEIEKHLAIQCVALVAGNCERLGNWHWRVWRNAGEYGYPLSGKDRFPPEMSPPALHSTLHKLVLTSAPALVRAFRSRYTLEHLAKKLEMAPANLEKLRRPLPWNEGLLKDAGFHLYASRIESRRYQVYNLPGLGRELFYEGSSRSLYLDEAHYRKMPPSHLFHRVLSVLWSVRIHYFVPLALHPIRDFWPFLTELGQMFGSAGISRLATKIGAKKGGTMAKRLEGMDLRQLRVLHEKLGRPSEEQVAQLWDAMRTHLYRLLIAETLDVIGVFEAILDRDLLQKNAMKHSELYQLSPFGKLLVEFVTKLRL